MMPNNIVDIVVVDDNVVLLATLSEILKTCGYSVRTASDGICALAEIRYQAPDVLLCDLNMPGISGFELLSIVRRCYPRIKVVATSGSYSGRAVPAGVAADAFYGKGTTSVADLLQMVSSMKDQSEVSLPRAATPIWISSALVDPTGGRSALVACPECLRVYPHSVTDAEYSQDTKCPHCSYLVQLAIVPTA
jgi:CheY-like chemotaxis protein